MFAVGDSAVEFFRVQCLGRLFSSLWGILLALVSMCVIVASVLNILPFGGELFRGVQSLRLAANPRSLRP